MLFEERGQVGVAIGHDKLARLVGIDPSNELLRETNALRKGTTLRGREDWARHYTLSAALAAGRPTALSHRASMADGLLTPSIGSFTWPILRRVVREAVQVSETAIGEAVRFLHREAGLRVEPSGAVTTAALLSGLPA